jgi:hypothetical protein
MPDDDEAPDQFWAIDRTEPPAPPAPPTPAVAAGPGFASALSADLTAAWSSRDRPAQLLLVASIAAFGIALVGQLMDVWRSGPFVLIVLVASGTAAALAWFGGSQAVRAWPVPARTIEHAATLVVAVLAILKAVEIVFDLDALDAAGGIAGLVLAVALAVAAAGMLVAVNRRGSDPLGDVTGGDWGARIATIGFALVVLGWAYDLSISFWTMREAALSLAVLTIAALTVVEAPRIQVGIPAAWVGAAIGAFGALLVIGHWSSLASLGRSQLELDPADFLGLFGYAAGTVLIIAGGVWSGLGSSSRTR